jgi:DNA polymerase
MLAEISLDFETRSALDLKKSGAYAYAQHASTDVWCMAWACDGQDGLWLPGDPPPAWARDAALRAWNAPFERVIWEYVLVPRYGFPRAALERWTCTAAEARAMALPGSLDQAAKALRVPAEKDDAGRRLMMRMARPRATVNGVHTWWDDRERRERLYAYCKQDVRVEQAVKEQVRRLRPAEREVWLLDQRINDRGVGLDLPLARAAVAMAARETERAGRRMAELTDGAVTSITDNGGLARWLETDSVAKDKVEALLACAEPGSNVAKVLALRQEVGKSSVAKFTAMLESASPDGRVHGALLYHGAGTGRWAGRLIQPQNFPSRGVLEHSIVERALPFVLDGNDEAVELVFGPRLQVLSSALRATLVAAPGYTLVAADYANIEGRVLAWMAGEEWRLRAFREFDAGVGPDLYKLSYSRAFGVPLAQVDKAMRQIGKVMELALGYQGGVGAFQTMARGYGVEISDERADQLKVAWREASPAVVAWWYALERAAHEAMGPAGVGEARGVVYRREGDWLTCTLPSGRKLYYARPSVRDETMPWGKVKPVVSAWGVDSYTKQWQKYSLYGGLLAENVVQAVARDIMAGGMLRVERAGYPVVLTVHDEIVAEPALDAPWSEEEFVALMLTLPKWAQGLPVAAEGWSGRRYRK